MHVRGSIRGAGSGIEMEANAWSVWSFAENGAENGKVTRMENFLPHEEAEAQRAFQAP
jgi:hypothetical protein